MERSGRNRVLMVVCALVVGLCARGQGKIIYVDDDVVWADDGSSWASAYTDLQDALAVAETGDEIRVAQGLYQPDRGADVALGDRAATFHLPDGVTLAGGYAGLFEPDPDARDVGRYVTVLSGDLFGNDTNIQDPCGLYDDPMRADNSLHVVTADQIGADSVLDGFVIAGGHAWPQHGGRGRTAPEGGAGLSVRFANPVVRNCVFTCNTADVGAGVLIGGGGLPVIRDCRFSMNAANVQGGGLFCDSGLLELTRCTFERNFAAGEGGGLCGGSPSATALEMSLVDCVFTHNSATQGGGMMISRVRDQLALKRCTFTGNTAYRGAGLKVMALSPSRPVILTDCTFFGNHADSLYALPALRADEVIGCGGGLHFTGVQAELTGCAFIDNMAAQGGGLDVTASDRCRLTNCLWAGNLAGEGGGAIYARTGALGLDHCTLQSHPTNAGGLLACEGASQHAPGPVRVTVTNSILRGGHCESCAIGCDPQDVSVTFSNVEGGWPGAGNIDVDPCFVSLGYLSRVGDAWVDGDYHLKSQAGRWDPISESWIEDEVTSPCIDAGDPNRSLGDEPFPNGGLVNLGAYGGTTEASKSYFGDPVCHTHLAGDVNGDCRIDIEDLRTVLSQWWPVGLFAEQNARVVFVEPTDGATLEMSSGPIMITAEIGEAETVANVVFHISHATSTFSYQGRCEGQQERNRWFAQWYWSGDSYPPSSGEHVIVVSWGASQAEHPPVSWRWAGAYRLPYGEYIITAEVTDKSGRTTVSSEVKVTIDRPPMTR